MIVPDNMINLAHITENVLFVRLDVVDLAP